MKIRTLKLQEMLTSAIRGAGNNKLIPLTNMLAINANEGKLCLTTTDASNYLYVSDHIEDKDNIYAVVDAGLFNSLVNKFTSEFIDLTLLDTSLQVTGNGRYLVALQFDESGKIVKFPQPSLVSANIEVDVNLSVIKDILKSNRAALADTLEIPIYTGYYVGDRIITTDTTKICELKENLFSEPILLSREFMDLVGIIPDDKIHFSMSGSDIEARGSTICVYGHLLSGIEEYQINDIDGLLKQDFESSCTIDRTDLINVLGRITLFIDNYDNGAIRLTFTDNCLDIQSLQSNGVESLPYIKDHNTHNFTALISAEMFLEQVKAINSDVVNIHYGSTNAIKIVDGNVVQIIALLQE